jgi:hypothetical protein
MDLNKNGVLDGQSNGLADFDGVYILENSRYDLPLVTTQTAPAALAAVLEDAGAALVRDAVDTRVINTVYSYGTQGAHIDSQTQVGGWPTLGTGSAWLDTDQDGMPDFYENMISYLEPNNPNDRNLDMNSNGYTDLEDYLNFLVAGPVLTGLAGDYNNNGILDAADYTAWRDALTAGATNLLNDSTPGVVDESDFTYWRAHFGETLGSGSGQATSATVPEPASLALLLWGGVLGISLLRKSRFCMSESG